MPLIKCPGCPAYISSEARKCPKCGRIFLGNSSPNSMADEEDFWKNNRNSLSGLNTYKTRYPNGRHIPECESLLQQYRRLSNKADLKETWSVVKAIIKYTGLSICAILLIVVIVICIKTKTWPVAGSVGPIYAAYHYLEKWEI